MATKMAHAVADKHETYRQRIDAMKKLLDMHTDALKTGKAKEKGPDAARHKLKMRGRAHQKSKVIAKDHTSPKAIQKGEKLILDTKQKSMRRLKLSAKDERIKAESEKADAAPSKLDSWMKAQVKKTAMAAKDAHHTAGAAHAAHAAPAKAHSPAHAHAAAHAAKPAAAHKGGRRTPYERLLSWAEAHGLPRKLADNPRDRSKVKHIIARMKADAEVEDIKKQFAHDDAVVGDVIHSADPGAAGAV